MRRKYIQIIPADGWYAQEDDGTIDPLVCFALTDEGQVVGLEVKGDGTVIAECTQESFKGYIFKGTKTPKNRYSSGEI